MKTCIDCGRQKEVGAFYRDSRYADGRPRAACKDCINERQRTPKKSYRPMPKACSKCGVVRPPHEFPNDPKHSDGLRSDCKKCFYSEAAYQKSLAYLRAHPDIRRVCNQRNAAKRAQYDRDHPEVRQAIGQRRRAKKIGNGANDLTAAQWKTIKAIYGHSCAYCGRQMARLEIEHVVPITEGGLHTAANIVPACRSCNAQKHDNPAPTHQPHLLV